MGKELAALVQELRNLVGIVAGAKRADVELKVGCHLCEELSGSWAQPGVVPRRIRIQLEVVNVLQVIRYAVICRVNQGLVQVNEKH